MSETLNRKKSAVEKLLGNHYKKCDYLVFEQVLSEWVFKAKEMPQGFTYGPVDKSEFLKYADKFKVIMPNAEERFEVGDICYGAKTEEQYAHLKWISFNRSYVSEIDNMIQLKPDSVYLYDGYTLPDYRGLGLTSITLSRAFQFLSEIGIKKAYSFILPYNFPILRSKGREKARKIGCISYSKIFGIKSLRVKGYTKEDRQTLDQMFLPEE